MVHAPCLLTLTIGKVFSQVSASQAELGLYLTVNVRDVYYQLGISQLFVLILVLSF